MEQANSHARNIVEGNQHGVGNYTLEAGINVMKAEREAICNRVTPCIRRRFSYAIARAVISSQSKYYRKCNKAFGSNARSLPDQNVSEMPETK